MRGGGARGCGERDGVQQPPLRVRRAAAAAVSARGCVSLSLSRQAVPRPVTRGARLTLRAGGDGGAAAGGGSAAEARARAAPRARQQRQQHARHGSAPACRCSAARCTPAPRLPLCAREASRALQHPRGPCDAHYKRAAGSRGGTCGFRRQMRRGSRTLLSCAAGCGRPHDDGARPAVVPAHGAAAAAASHLRDPALPIAGKRRAGRGGNLSAACLRARSCKQRLSQMRDPSAKRAGGEEGLAPPGPVQKADAAKRLRMRDLARRALCRGTLSEAEPAAAPARLTRLALAAHSLQISLLCASSGQGRQSRVSQHAVQGGR
jgi:hypothetical protein